MVSGLIKGLTVAWIPSAGVRTSSHARSSASNQGRPSLSVALMWHSQLALRPAPPKAGLTSTAPASADGCLTTMVLGTVDVNGPGGCTPPSPFILAAACAACPEEKERVRARVREAGE
eukprot:1179200-Prorocentrum_minimum.AAC.3